MKKLISTIVAVTFALGAAVPAHAFGETSGCSDKHEQVSRFNPTDLSDYQQCVYEWSGKTHGTVGNYIWIQSLPGVFTYIAIQDLQGMSRADAKKLITVEVIKTVIDMGLQQQVADLTKERNDLLTALGTDTTAEALARIGEISRELLNLEQRLDIINSATDVSFKDYTAYGLGLGVEIAYPDAQGVTTTAFYSIGTNYDNTVDTTDRGPNYTSADDAAVLGAPAPGTPPFYTVTLNGTNIGGDGLSESIARDILNVVNDAINAAYDKGYEDGYEDGYNDGYADGFADGVASVE